MSVWRGILNVLLGRHDVPSADSADNNYIRDVIGNKSDTVAGDSAIASLKRIEVAVGGAAMQLQTEQSISAAVEEDGVQNFSISLIDIDSGAVSSANIDITGISATLEKSTGGAAFSSAGITQPTFAKDNGLVSVDYRFLDAEWTNGDIYKLSVSGIECTLGGDTAYVNEVIWSNVVTDAIGIEAKIDVIDGFHDVPSADSADNVVISDVVGNKTDTVSGNSVIALLKQILAMPVSSDDSSGTYSYLDAGGEQTVEEITTSTRIKIVGISLDLTNMTQNGTIKIYEKIDGSNYRELQDYSYAIGDSVGWKLTSPLAVTSDFKITYEESGGDEGAARSIPYVIIWEVLE